MARAGGFTQAFLPRSQQRPPGESLVAHLEEKGHIAPVTVAQGSRKSKLRVATSRFQKYGQQKGRLLNRRSVQTNTAHRYESLISRFESFLALNCNQTLAEMHENETLDAALAEMIHALFWDGEALGTATSMLAAVGWVFPDVGRFGTAPMPTTRQALQGFSRLAPAGGRLALPPAVVDAIINSVADLGWLRLARCMKLAEALYLRPGELHQIRCRQLVAPTAGACTKVWSLVLHPWEDGIASKTHQHDDGLLLDGPNAQLLGQLTVLITQGRAPQELITGISVVQYREVFKQAVATAGVGILGPVPYQLRHSGASRDLNEQIRDLAAVKKRGRWQSERSLQRYLKGGRTAEQFRRLPDLVQRRCEQCQLSIGATLLGVSPPLRA